MWSSILNHAPYSSLWKAALLIAITAPFELFTKNYKGAELITHETYQFGAVEARIQAAKGSGIITAFFYWKHGSENAGTEWQEQDIEIFGKDGTYQTQIITPGNPRTENSQPHSLATDAWEKYYTYRMEWTPEHLSFYIDGELVRRETDTDRFNKHLSQERAQPAQIRLSVWASDNPWSGRFDPTQVPTATFVDYIEVYNYDHASESFVLDWRDDFDVIDTSRWWFANWTFDVAKNDYVAQNARAIDGKLVLAFTDKKNSGTFPIPPPNE